MKQILLAVVVLLSITACKNKTEETPVETEVIPEVKNESVATYPVEITAIFDAHGGTEAWSKMNTLHFEIPKESGPEKHTVALRDRRSIIETAGWNIGYDGTDVWLLQKKEEAYQGNARFYHNVMFYFYAMPFVLADEGINYSPVAATELDGLSYPGIKISYNNGVGDAPKDEYIAFYNPETYQMTWLAYTVTYGTDEKSENWRYIKYADWTTENGLVLPKALTWYKVEEGKPTIPRNTMAFEGISISESQPDAALFEKPEGATVSEF